MIGSLNQTAQLLLASSGLAALFAVAIAVLTLTRNPAKPLNRAGAALFAVLAVSHLGGMVAYLQWWGISVWLAAEGVLPAAILAFGRRLWRSEGGATRLFAAIGRSAWGLGAVVLGVAAFGPRPERDASGTFYLPGYGKWLVIGVLLLHVAALLKLENIFRATEGAARWTLKYLLLGVAAIVAMRIYVLTQVSLYGAIGMESGIELAVATLIGGAMFTFAIVRHRLLDVDIFVSRYVIYNSVTLGVIAAYLLIVGATVYGIQQFGGSLSVPLASAAIFIALVVLGVALVSETFRWRVRHFVDRNFYRNLHDYRREWQTVTRAVAAEGSVDGLLSSLSRMMTASVGASSVICLLRDGTADRFREAPSPPATPPLVLHADEIVPDTRPMWGTGENSMAVYRAARRPDDLMLPLAFGDEKIGWIMLGPAISGKPYHLENLELACAMAAQTAVSVRNLQLAEDLVRSREQAALHQLSTFFIHDMKNTANSLGLLARNIRKNRDNPAFWDDAETGITGAVKQIDTLMERLRELRDQALPDLRPVDLSGLLSGCAGQWRQAVSGTVTVEAEDGLYCLGDVPLLESVFTNLVTNAEQAGASTISMTCHNEGGGLRVVVADNGHGMDRDFLENQLFKPFVSTRRDGMGIGLFQSRRAVERMGGSMTATSTPGTGSRFTVILPAAAPEKGEHD